MLLCLLVWPGTTSVWANDVSGTLHITVAVNDKPTVAEVRVTKHGAAGYVYWTIYQKGGPALQTPLDIPLPAGAYDIYVKPAFGRRTLSMPKEKTVSLTIEADKQQRETINFQSAHLTVSAREAGGRGLSNAAIGIINGWEPNKLPSLHSRHLPAEFAIAPGKHTIVVEDSKTRARKQVRIDVVAGQTLDQNVAFDKADVGFLAVNLMKDGKPVAPRDFNRYAIVAIISATTQKPVHPLSGGYGNPSVLPSGLYDIVVHMSALGAGDQKFGNIQIDRGKRVVRRVTIHQPGTLKITAKWTHQPLNIVACARYYNPFNPARLGALMGGHSVSRGKCLSPVAHMAAWISSPGRNDGNIAKIISAPSGSKYRSYLNIDPSLISLSAGTYDIAVWPRNHRELMQTLKGMKITAGEILKKNLEFRWPSKKK